MELEHQSNLAIIAYSDIIQSNASGDGNRIWYSIQSFLIAVGNISKILWGTDDKIKIRRANLRQLLSIDDNSVLNSRRFRNHFEHFDERLEDLANSIPAGTSYVDSNIGPPNFIYTGQSKSLDLRFFDNQNFILKFSGETYQLQPVFDAVKILFQVVMERSNH